MRNKGAFDYMGILSKILKKVQKKFLPNFFPNYGGIQTQTITNFANTLHEE
jgi:hypothetical protein